MPLRVMVVGSYAPSLLNFRGPLMKELRRRGCDVVACAPNITAEIRADLDAIGVRAREIPMARAGMSPVSDLRTLKALRRIMREESPDRVLAYTAKPVIYSALAARRFVGVQVHAMITGLGYAFGDTAKQRAVGTIVRMLYRTALKHCHGIFFQNPDDRQIFAKRGLIDAGAKVTMINGSGVDLTWFTPTPRPVLPVFLLVARLLADKGIREYYAAARIVKSRFPDTRFLLAGFLDPNPMSIGAVELEMWQKEGIIEYLGDLSDVRPAYAGCSVYVLPSYREGTPRTVLEAMAMERAIITTDVPGCRETVEHGRNGFLVPVRDAVQLAEAMERFIVDPEVAHTMGAASLEMAREKFDVRMVNRIIIEALDVQY